MIEDNEEASCCWKAIRFTCKGSTSIKFRKCVQNVFIQKDLPENIISTRKPSAKSLLYRIAAQEPPIFNKLALVDLL